MTTSALSVFSRPATGLSPAVSVTVRSSPLDCPTTAGSLSQPTMNVYGPTIRVSCAAAGVARMPKDATTTAMAAAMAGIRVM